MLLPGETIPIRLFLGGFDLTPTFRDVNKKFSTRYYLNLVLIDEENRRYFKQQVTFSAKIRRYPPLLIVSLPQEITVFRIPEVRLNIRRWFCWSVLTVSLSELMDVIFSCVLLYLTVDYVLCAFLLSKFMSGSVGARA